MNWLLKYFRPHIIEENGFFYVRRLDPNYKYNIIWEYLGNKDRQSWWGDNYQDFGKFNTEKEAVNAYDNFVKNSKTKKVIPKVKIKKIL